MASRHSMVFLLLGVMSITTAVLAKHTNTNELGTKMRPFMMIEPPINNPPIEEPTKNPPIDLQTKTTNVPYDHELQIEKPSYIIDPPTENSPITEPPTLAKATPHEKPLTFELLPIDKPAWIDPRPSQKPLQMEKIYIPPPPEIYLAH